MRGLLLGAIVSVAWGCGGGGGPAANFIIMNQSGDCLLRVQIFRVDDPEQFEALQDLRYGPPGLQGTDVIEPDQAVEFNPPIPPGGTRGFAIAVPDGSYRIDVLSFAADTGDGPPDCSTGAGDTNVITLADEEFPFGLRPGTSCVATIRDGEFELTCETPR